MQINEAAIFGLCQLFSCVKLAPFCAWCGVCRWQPRHSSVEGLKVVRDWTSYVDRGRMGDWPMDIFAMNIDQFINERIQWFDFSTYMVIHYPVLSVTGAVIAYLLYQVVTTVQLTGAIISAGVGVVYGYSLNVLSS